MAELIPPYIVGKEVLPINMSSNIVGKGNSTVSISGNGHLSFFDKNNGTTGTFVLPNDRGIFNFTVEMPVKVHAISKYYYDGGGSSGNALDLYRLNDMDLYEKIFTTELTNTFDVWKPLTNVLMPGDYRFVATKRYTTFSLMYFEKIEYYVNYDNVDINNIDNVINIKYDINLKEIRGNYIKQFIKKIDDTLIKEINPQLTNIPEKTLTDVFF